MSDNNDHSIESDDSEDEHGANENHEDDHQSRRYDRTTLLVIAESMEEANYRSSKDNLQCLLHPPPRFHTISYQQLDHWKRLSKTVYDQGCSDIEDIELSKMRRLSKIAKSQGCYEHPGDANTTKGYVTPVQGGFFTGSAAESGGGSVAAGERPRRHTARTTTAHHYATCTFHNYHLHRL